MYIPYEKFGNLIYQLFKNERLKTFFYNKKVKQNLNFIKNNQLNVIKKIKNKIKKRETLVVLFYVNDETKWKCQSVYDEFASDTRFSVKVIATKNNAKSPDNPSFQTNLDVKRVYEFFKNKNMNVEYGYDLRTEEFIPFKKFSPDIIFYQQPWYVETSQGPVVSSKFAITAYTPYYFPLEADKVDYSLRFHQYVQRYYILDEYTKCKYESKMENSGANLKVVGYPYLDNYKQIDNKKDYIIYAPHWTVAQKGLAYSTFEWSGQFLLEYAKKSTLNWVFKPHPLLFKALIDNKIMTKLEAESYYAEWGKLGIKCESGDYLDLFAQSAMMITDSSSFLGEFAITNKPLIHLLSEKSQFRNSENPLLKIHYRAESLDELKNLLSTLPENDYKKELREKELIKLNFKNSIASKNIYKDILEIIDA